MRPYGPHPNQMESILPATQVPLELPDIINATVDIVLDGSVPLRIGLSGPLYHLRCYSGVIALRCKCSRNINRCLPPQNDPLKQDENR